MRKRFFVVAVLGLLLLITCSVYLFIQIKNLSICEDRFNGVRLSEFAEANEAKVTKVVVDFHDSKTRFEITEPEKIETAINFMKGRHDNWQEPCLVPVGDVIGLDFIDETGDNIGHYGFWSSFIIYYGGSKQPELPPAILLPIENKERTTLFKELEIPIELVNDRLGFEE